MDVLDGGPVEGFVGFFDVQFKGSPQNPTDFPVSQPSSVAPHPSQMTRPSFLPCGNLSVACLYIAWVTQSLARRGCVLCVLNIWL